MMSPMYEFTTVQCKYNGVDCLQYMENTGACLAAEVDFEYKIKNVGISCHTIEELSTEFNAADSRILALDATIGCTSRHSCPGSIWTLSEKRFIDFCNGFDTKITMDVDTDNGSTEIEIEIQIDAGIPVVTLSPIIRGGDVCTEHPTELLFTYTPQVCSSSDNGQYEKFQIRRNLRHSKKTSDSSDSTTVVRSPVPDTSNNDSTTVTDYECCDKNGGLTKYDDRVSIEISSIDEETQYFSANNVCEFTEISVGNGRDLVASALLIKVYDSEGMLKQKLTLHSSCSQMLKTGDVFGSFQLTGFKN